MILLRLGKADRPITSRLSRLVPPSRMPLQQHCAGSLWIGGHGRFGNESAWDRSEVCNPSDPMWITRQDSVVTVLEKGQWTPSTVIHISGSSSLVLIAGLNVGGSGHYLASNSQVYHLPIDIEN